MTHAIAAIVLLVGVLAWRFVHWFRIYGPAFTDDHYSEIATWVAAVLAKHPVDSPSLDDGTSVVTSKGVALGYTSVDEDGDRSIHFTINDAKRPTMPSLGSRMISLILCLMQPNKCTMNAFQTPSRVHHLVFTIPDNSPVQLAEPKVAVADMRNRNRIRIPVVTLS